MSFQSYLFLITYLMASIGLFAALLVEEISIIFIAPVAAAALSSLVFNLKKKKPLPGFIWNVCAALVLVFFLIDYSGSGSLIVSASRFLAVLLALKLFDLNKDRDFLIAYGIVFFQVLAAAGSTVSPVFFLLLFLFIIGSIWAMILYTLKKDRAETAPEPRGLPRDFFGAPFFVSVFAASAFSLLMTFGLFFVLPRIGIGVFEKKTLDTVKVTGFSDRVDIGALGPVKKDSTIVMRVEMKGSGTLPYLRGMTLDHYDGGSWTRTVKDSVLVRKSSGVFRMGEPSTKGGRLIEQNIILEPLETEALFAAGYPVLVEADFSNIWLDGSGTMRLPAPPYSRVEYRAWTKASPDDRGLPRPMPIDDYLDASFLDAGSRSRISALLSEAVKDKSGTDEKAQALREWLTANYRYTLDPARSGEASPLEEFLFGSKEGYCEHYATAMAIMLRLSGVPSRIVTGFLPGEWNSYGNYYIVRQQDAHSWVEAYIEGKGWTAYDPTPSAGLSPYSAPSRLSLYLDYLRLKWSRYVIHFSSTDQRRAALAVENAAGKMAGSFRSGSLKGLGRGPLYLIIAAAIIIAVIAALKAFRKGGNRPKRTPPYYKEMERILLKKGFSRAKGETPLEFAKRVRVREAMDITLVFQSERYGGERPAAKEAESVRAALERLKNKEN